MSALVVCAASSALGQDLRYPPPPLQDRRGYEVNSWLKLKPYLRAGVFYTDNIFLTSNSVRRGDTVYDLTPGIDVVLRQNDDRWLELGYAATAFLYHHFHDLHAVEHRLRYVGQSKWGDLLATSSGSATWAVYNSDPQFAGRVRNFQGNANLDLSYALTEVWGVKSTGYVSESRNFPDRLEPTNTQEWGMGAFLTAAPHTDDPLQLLAGATFREVHYFDHAATLPDLSLAGPAAGAKFELPERLRIDALGGVELPWIKKHNAASRDDDPPVTPAVNASVWVSPRDGTALLVVARYRLDASASAPWQRSTTISGELTQDLPADLQARLLATWTLRQPHHDPDLRQQSYQAQLIWSPWEHLELGGQVGYTRLGVKGGGYEAFTIGAALTLKL